MMGQEEGACISMAWLTTQVEEAECEVENQKALTFRGKGPGPPRTKVGMICHGLIDLYQGLCSISGIQ